MRSLEDFKTTEELNKWASERGLMNDDIVNLRRVEIMADAVTNQREKVDYVCDSCGHRFTEKTNLLRHMRTIHSDKQQHPDECKLGVLPHPDPHIGLYREIHRSASA